MVISSLAPFLVVGMARPTENTIQRVGGTNFEKHTDLMPGAGAG